MEFGINMVGAGSGYNGVSGITIGPFTTVANEILNGRVSRDLMGPSRIGNILKAFGEGVNDSLEAMGIGGRDYDTRSIEESTFYNIDENTMGTGKNRAMITVEDGIITNAFLGQKNNNTSDGIGQSSFRPIREGIDAFLNRAENDPSIIVETFNQFLSEYELATESDTGVKGVLIGEQLYPLPERPSYTKELETGGAILVDGTFNESFHR